MRQDRHRAGICAWDCVSARPAVLCSVWHRACHIHNSGNHLPGCVTLCCRCNLRHTRLLKILLCHLDRHCVQEACYAHDRALMQTPVLLPLAPCRTRVLLIYDDELPPLHTQLAHPAWADFAQATSLVEIPVARAGSAGPARDRRRSTLAAYLFQLWCQLLHSSHPLEPLQRLFH